MDAGLTFSVCVTMHVDQPSPCDLLGLVTRSCHAHAAMERHARSLITLIIRHSAVSTSCATTHTPCPRTTTSDLEPWRDPPTALTFEIQPSFYSILCSPLSSVSYRYADSGSNVECRMSNVELHSSPLGFPTDMQIRVRMSHRFDAFCRVQWCEDERV